MSEISTPVNKYPERDYYPQGVEVYRRNGTDEPEYFGTMASNNKAKRCAQALNLYASKYERRGIEKKAFNSEAGNRIRESFAPKVGR